VTLFSIAAIEFSLLITEVISTFKELFSIIVSEMKMRLLETIWKTTNKEEIFKKN